ncbi:MAG TPA: hypothetical protein VGN20_28310 [Mucilaginibacter sp.]
MPPVMLYYLTSKENVREVVFKYDKNKYANYGFDKDAKPTTLSKAELAEMKKLIKARVAVYNQGKNPKDRYEFIKEPEKYFKQIIPVINSKGEKELWVQCSCQVMKDYWQKGIGVTSDGGICNLVFRINLTKRSVMSFSRAGDG